MSRPDGIPALTPRAVAKEVLRLVDDGAFAWKLGKWRLSDEADDDDYLENAPGVYFIVEVVRSKQHPRGVRVARYSGESQAVRSETKRQRICRIVGGCDGKVRFFALYTGKAERIDRREVEWALHQRFKPTISTARRPRKPKQ